MAFSNYFDKNFIAPVILSLINIVVLSYLIWAEPKIADLFIQAFISSIGGIIAAILTFYLTLKGRIRNKRYDKFNDHKNTLVQIEHELLPARINMDTNIRALEDAIQQIDQGTPRLILRMRKIDFSTGLSLKLLSIELINNYSELYVLLEKINTDIEYLNQIVEKIQASADQQKNILNLLIAYEKLIKYLVLQCKRADQKMLELVSKCQIVLSVEEEDVHKSKYQKDGKQIEYIFNEDELNKKKQNLISQEKRPYTNSETPDQIFMLYLDLMMVVEK